MKTHFYSLLLFLFIFTGCASQFPPLANTGKTAGSLSPAAVFIAEKIHKFETVTAGTIVSHDFIVKNTGGRALILSRISAG